MSGIAGMLRAARAIAWTRSDRPALGGCNLLPHRQWRIRTMRRRRTLCIACAALGGIGMAASVAALDDRAISRLDEQRDDREHALSAIAPQLAEHARWSATLAHDARADRAARLGVVRRDHLIALLRRLADAGSPPVALTELHRRDDTTTLAGRAADERAFAVWLNGLRGADGVTSTEIASMRRTSAKGSSGVDFVVRIGHGRAGDGGGGGDGGAQGKASRGSGAVGDAR
jgi:type IV pilus assembly protein PilN